MPIMVRASIVMDTYEDYAHGFTFGDDGDRMSSVHAQRLLEDMHGTEFEIDLEEYRRVKTRPWPHEEL